MLRCVHCTVYGSCLAVKILLVNGQFHVDGFPLFVSLRRVLALLLNHCFHFHFHFNFNYPGSFHAHHFNGILFPIAFQKKNKKRKRTNFCWKTHQLPLLLQNPSLVVIVFIFAAVNFLTLILKNILLLLFIPSCLASFHHRQHLGKEECTSFLVCALFCIAPRIHPF